MTGRIKNRIALLCLAALSTLVVSGCGPVISKETLKDVDRSLRFQDVVKDPSAYRGREVVFGGTILSVENIGDETVMEVVEEGMNSQLKPVSPEASAGRFLAAFKGFRDPAIYSPGKRITVAGTVKGVETRPLGKATYRYPVIESKEHYLWERRGYEREPSIGIGFGFGFTHID